MSGFTPGPYSLAGTEPIVIEGVERVPARYMRDNDGSLIIMAPCDPEEFASDRKRIGTVGLTIDVKRGQGWKVTADEDPAQMAVARLWLASPGLLSALRRISAATMASTNSGTLAEYQSWVRAVADTAIADTTDRSAMPRDEP